MKLKRLLKKKDEETLGNWPQILQAKFSDIILSFHLFSLSFCTLVFCSFYLNVLFLSFYPNISLSLLSCVFCPFYPDVLSFFLCFFSLFILMFSLSLLSVFLFPFCVSFYMRIIFMSAFSLCDLLTSDSVSRNKVKKYWSLFLAFRKSFFMV